MDFDEYQKVYESKRGLNKELSAEKFICHSSYCERFLHLIKEKFYSLSKTIITIGVQAAYMMLELPTTNPFKYISKQDLQ